ncbi:hypothetical protein Syun_021848 [Stephania yunnanensis]|uniref:t-SNARE coiled-coil homology domain-containing protein n=1 Tax=Stephania yunnanensis TaxID=152371 RepID=A0AAP0IHT3_9MAGN
MSVIDILTRVDSICKKYDKYDVDKQKDLNAAGSDAFAHLYSSIESDIDTTLEKWEVALNEKNRAAAVAMKAEVRRSKAKLVEEVAKLQKLSLKKVKGQSKEELLARNDLVIALTERVQAIPDASTASNQGGSSAGAGLGTRSEITFDSTSGGAFDSDLYEQSEESSQFRNEYDTRKIKQDEGLDIISQGLNTLKNMANDMNEELDRQVPLIDEIDEKVDRATSHLKNTNVRLKDTLTQLRSSRNFCIDIILVCVILGIASYLYK